MGRLTYMALLRGNDSASRVASLGLVVALMTGCALESPIEVSDRPLSERLADRRAETEASEQAALDAAESVDTDDGDEAGISADAAPDAIALTDVELFEAPGLILLIDGNLLGIELKDGPGSGYRMIASIPFGAEVVTLGAMTGEWTYVAYADFDGWIYSQLASLEDASGAGTQPADTGEPNTYVVSDEVIGVNMRSGPTVDDELVSGAPAGSIVEGTGRTSDEWVEVTFNGVTGWAHGRYLIVE